MNKDQIELTRLLAEYIHTSNLIVLAQVHILSKEILENEGVLDLVVQLGTLSDKTSENGQNDAN